MAKPRSRTEEQRPSRPRTFRRGIEKNRAAGPRRSARLKRASSIDEGREEIKGERYPKSTTQVSPRKRKRQNEPEREDEVDLATKRPRSYSTSAETKTPGARETSPAEDISLVGYWTRERRWPKRYFELDEDTYAYITRDPEEDSLWRAIWSAMEHPDPPVPKDRLGRMRAALARKRSSSSLRRLEGGSSATPSDQKPRERKSVQYQRPNYRTFLATKGSFMDKDELGVKGDCKVLYRTLLEGDQDIPRESLFRDDIFEKTCRRVQDRNEARIIQDISRLIIPSAETLATYGAKHLDGLVETVNEGWNNSVPLEGLPRPQPDYSVGFGRSAFSDEQLNKLQPFIGELTETSFFMATYFMYFPFLTCEVKCGAAALDVADRQNAHSMTLAVRGVVELFKLVYREKELDRQILAFSVSHDHQSVRIYGHYPVIDGKNITFYRYPIRKFDFTELDGKEKWTAYKFTKNVYDIWMPEHFKRLCSIIDQLPAGIDFELSEQSELQFQDTGLSQDFRDYSLSQSNADSVSLQGDSQGSASGAHDTTPETSVSQPPAFKKPRKRHVAE